jgi:hypothetical protein
MWERFNILHYDFDLQGSEQSVDVILIIKTNSDFQYDSLPMNMVLKSPAGEERIREFCMQFGKTNPLQEKLQSGDTIIYSMVLKKGLEIKTNGLLKIEIENLNPRINTEGIYSAGIRLSFR